MCLAIPGRVLEITLEQDLLFGQVEFAGTAKRVCMELVPEAKVGDYVLVYAGYGLSIVDEAEAQRLLQFYAEMNEFGELQTAPD